MSLKASTLTKNTKQSPSLDKAFGNYTKLGNKAFLKPASQFHLHKRTSSDVPTFNNYVKPISSVLQPYRQAASKKPQTSLSKSPISSRKAITTSTCYTREDISSRRQRTNVELSPGRNQSYIYYNKSPLATRPDNSPGQQSHRLVTESKALISSSRYTGRRISVEDIIFEKEEILFPVNKQLLHVQAKVQPNLNKRSSAGCVSPFSQSNSRPTSKKASVCDVSQQLSQLQEELDTINEERRRGPTSKPIFEAYKDHTTRNQYSNNDSHFALYSEIKKEKKKPTHPGSETKRRIPDTRRALNSSPLSVENRFLYKDHKQRSQDSHRDVKTDISSSIIDRSHLIGTDKSIEKGLLDIAYVKMLKEKARTQTVHDFQEPNESLYTEYLIKESKHSRLKTDSVINMESAFPRRIETPSVYDDFDGELNTSSMKISKDLKRSNLSTNPRLGQSEQKTSQADQSNERVDLLYSKRMKSSNASIEVIHEEECPAGPSIFPRFGRDKNVYAKLIDQADIEIQSVLGGLQQRNNAQKIAKSREVSQNKSDLVGAQKSASSLRTPRHLIDTVRSQNNGKENEVSLNSSFEKDLSTSRSPVLLSKISARNITDNKSDTETPRDFDRNDLRRRRLEKKLQGMSEQKLARDSQIKMARHMQVEVPFAGSGINEPMKPAHKKNSKSYTPENAFEEILKGLNLPINITNAKKEESLTASNISRHTSNDLTPKLSNNLTENELREIVPLSNDQETSVDKRNDDEYLREKLIKIIKDSFKTSNNGPSTTLDFYRLVKMIGKGTFGKVFLGVHLLTGRYVAVKSIEKKYIKDENAQKKIFQEVLILKKLNHSKVIRLLEVFENKKYLFIVLEYASRGDLLRYVKKKGRLSEENSKELFKQIISGLRHCHQNLVLHRDIKLDNVLLDENNNVKICDFGVSRFVKKGHVIKEQCGTPAYIAPEIIRNKGYEGCYADIWSLGVLLYAMVTGTVPFKAENLEELHKVIFKGKFSFPKFLSEACKDLIAKMIQVNPYSRISLESMSEHSWFQKSPEVGRRESMSGTNTFDEKIMSTEHRRANSMDKQYNKSSNLTEDESCNQVHIVDSIVRKVEELGYPKSFVVKSVNSNSCNHASASYYLLYEDYKRKF